MYIRSQWKALPWRKHGRKNMKQWVHCLHSQEAEKGTLVLSWLFLWLGLGPQPMETPHKYTHCRVSLYCGLEGDDLIFFFLWRRTYITHLIHCCCQYSCIKAFRVTSCTTIFAIIYFSIALLKISWNQANKQELIWVGDPTRKQMVFSKCYSLRKAHWYKGAVYKGISLEKQLSVWIAWVEKWFSEPEGKSRWKHCFERSLDLQWGSSQPEVRTETDTVYMGQSSEPES